MLKPILLLSLLTSSTSAQTIPTTLPSGLGVNIHFTHPRPGELKMLKGAGFRFVRMDFTWNQTEKEKGKYDFSDYDHLMQELDGASIRALFILDYANPLYDEGKSPHTDSGRTAFASWAAAAVAHFKGRDILWEMYNEPNIAQFWHPAPNADDYAKLAVAVGEAIRKAAPNEIYIGPASSTMDFAFLEKCFQAGVLEYWSAVTVHPYRNQPPETVEEDYRTLRMLIRKYAPKGKTIPIFSGEWGYSSAWGGFDLEKQGKFLPRQWLINLMNEVPLSIWYDWHDDGPDPKEPEHHFGTVLHPYHEGRDPVYDVKPAYTAAKTFTTMLDGFKYNKRLVGSMPSDYIAMFDKGQEVRYVAWSLLDRPHDVTLPATAGTKFTLYDHLGVKIATPEAGDNGLSFQPNDAPTYIVPDKPDNVMRAVAAWERAPLEIVGKHSEITQASLKFKNPLDQRVRISSTVVGASSKQMVRAGMTVPLRVRISLLREPGVVTWPIDLRIGEGPEARQSMRFVITNPLVASVFPPAAGRLVVQVENPSGEAFDGSVRASVHMGPRQEPQAVSQPLQIARGQKDARVIFSFDQGSTFMIEIVDSANHAFTAVEYQRFSEVPMSLTDYEIRSEGDKKVPSTQTIGLADAPDAPPGPIESTMKITYAFDPGWKYLSVKKNDQATMLPGPPRSALMWVRGDGTGNVIRFRFVDSGGQTFQPDGPKLTDKTWRLVEFPLDGSNGGHWGGATDGIVHHPIRIDSLLLIDNPSKLKTQGEVFIANPVLIYPPSAR